MIILNLYGRLRRYSGARILKDLSVRSGPALLVPCKRLIQAGFSHTCLGLVFMCMILLSSAPAQAQGSCYSPDELWAEQLLRIHSELMVITVTCKSSSKGQPLVPAYTGFTHRHQRAIARAEANMQAYYKAAGRHKGRVSSLDQLRTRLANEFGLSVAQARPRAFCRQYRDKVVDMQNLSSDRLDREVRLASVAKATYKPLCQVFN